ncbi:acetyl-CoA C-acetyltransferase [Ostertagia ostertagi]
MLGRSSIVGRRALSVTTSLRNKEVFIIGAARTPIGSFRSQTHKLSYHRHYPSIKSARTESQVHPWLLRSPNETASKRERMEYERMVSQDAYDLCPYGKLWKRKNCAKELEISLEIAQEAQYAIGSYKKSAAPASFQQGGIMSAEVVPVTVKSRKGDVIVDSDEEYKKVDFDKLKKLKTVFKKDGTVTAGNASTLNDGAAAVLLASSEAVKEHGCKPQAKIVAFADAATNPLDFALAPPMVVIKLLQSSGLKMTEIDHWEVNEAFSVVPLAFIKQVGCDEEKVNPHGGAVSIGHPIGMSGARLITHLVHVLKPEKLDLVVMSDDTVVILAGVRTPIASFRGSFASLSAVELAATAGRTAVERSGLTPNDIEETFVGSVLTANCGQNVARQVAIAIGIPKTSQAVTINKVCSSSMKALALGVLSIKSGYRKKVLVAGCENMSQVPFYLPRGEIPYGGINIVVVQDGIAKDGLQDSMLHSPMGLCAEKSVKKGLFAEEVIPVSVKPPRGATFVVSEDEEYKKLMESKVPTLKPVFVSDGTGTITAANASSLNDGGVAAVVVRGDQIPEGASPLAVVVSFAEAGGEPVDFTIAPVLALLEQTNLSTNDIALWEVNEAFSATVLAFMKELNLDPAYVNVKGGAVALGHPLGMSGLRIVLSLAYSLSSGDLGIAAICNGGGEAMAMLIRKL